MCDQSEIEYSDGEVVWVKLSRSLWWPGQVVGPEKLPPDVMPSFQKPPIAVVKFFQEDTFEYVKNINGIYKYNCSRKNEFISKGLRLFRAKQGHMEKFPEDVVKAEVTVGGDEDILSREEFQEAKRESYKTLGLFGEQGKKTPATAKQGRGRSTKESPSVSTPTRQFKEKSDYKVHILVQQGQPNQPVVQPNQPMAQPREPVNRQSTDAAPSPSTSRAGSEAAEDKPRKVDSPTPSTSSTPVTPGSGIYACHSCSFTTARLNVLILHNKTHSVTFTPYTPSPVRKKPAPTKPTPKSTPKTSKQPKTPRPRKEKSEKTPKKPSQGKKRAAEEKLEAEVKKAKTDEEIKSSLLADWDDDADDESNDESVGLLVSRSPEVPAGSESPAVPTPAELPDPQLSREATPPFEKKAEETAAEKPECSSDSKYEFCEDEDWHVEADVGRKIPRVKNPSQRKEDTKSLSLDEDEVAKEVAELLNKTAVPELPSVPEPLKVEENFPEPSIVKSPDKKSDNAAEANKSESAGAESKPTKAIFKTKTFFRSRHSRSQDAIGKYVAEQLNPERIDMLENEMNGSEAVSSPEARESPPVDHVKVARLAPKMQLKKIKAQLREKEKNVTDWMDTVEGTKSTDTTEFEFDNLDTILPQKSSQDVIYPTQEIKPINKDVTDKMHHKEPDKVELDNAGKINEDINKQSNEIGKASELVHEMCDKNIEYGKSIQSEPSPLKFIESADKPSEELYDTHETKSCVQDNPSDMEISIDYNKKIVHECEIATNKKEDKSSVSDAQILQDLLINTSPEKGKVPLEDRRSMCNLGTVEDICETSLPKTPKKIDMAHVSPVQSRAQKSYQPSIEPYMNESTASAVDALLSVSREADRVPRIIGSGPPEDLFEDDNKEAMITDDGVNTIVKDNVICKDLEPNHENTETGELVQDLNGITNNEFIHEIVETEIPSKDNEMIVDKEDTAAEILPSESDLQIAETLLNLPSTALQNKSKDPQELVSVPMCIDNQQFEEEVSESIVETVVENDVKSYEADEIVVNEVNSDLLIKNNKNMNIRYETEQEKSENLNAAQSLVEMSEFIDHKMNIAESNILNNKDIPNAILNAKQNNGIEPPLVERKVEALSSENNNDLLSNTKTTKSENISSRLLKILEEPITLKVPVTKTTPIKQTTPLKQVLVSGKEKILNFDVAKAAIKSKSQASKQKIIIRRTGPGKNFINNLSDVVASPDKIILSRTNVSGQDGSSVQTFTIQGSEISTSSEAKQIIIQPKIRKVTQPKTLTKLQKIKPQNSLVQWNETKTTSKTSVAEEPMFDISSMPVVLSDDILTPESIEKMPIVMSDGNIITNTPTPPKLVKTAKPTILENEKVTISASPSKPEPKSLIMNTVTTTATDANKVTTPNILSKSAKLRGAKPMLVIDKTTGKQKIIMTKAEPTVVKEPKPAPTIIQPAPQTATKTEKFIILPTSGSPRPARAQKIVIDPQTGKAHVLVAKGQEAPLSGPAADNKPVSAKLIPSSSDSSSPGNTVMIITNAQGTQSRIVLTPEHEKILFPNKQQPNMSQLKAITQRITTNATAPKTVINASPAKPPTKIVPKQKNAIITSKGQLIVGGRVATTAQNIAPMPEIRPAPKPEIRSVPKKIVAAEPKKLMQAIQKNASEPLIFLQQKSGAVMQLTAAQFEHLQRTGQIVQKSPAPAPASVQEKIVVQKTITIPPKETVGSVVQKQRIRKSAVASPTPAKRVKQEIAIAPAPTPAMPPMPPLTSLSNTVQTHSLSSIVPSASNTVSVTTSSYPDLNNFEDLLPTSAIARPPAVEPPAALMPQPEPVAPPPEPVAEPPPAQLSDGQLLAVPGENFGGPPGSFYLCVEDNGTLTPIDNRPLVLENNQLVPMAIETMPVFAPQPERRDILEAALANSDVFHADATRDEAPDFRDLNANVSVHCRVSETSTTLNQPIMTPVEVPTKGDSEPTVHSNLEDGLAVIGVTPHTVPTSLELPITVTDPRIAPKTTDPLSNSNYGTALLTSPNTDMSFVTAEETEVVGGPISMPLLTDDESVGKSMPILTDDVAERTVSSVESTVGSPSSCDVRESEPEEGGPWSRRLLTPGTDVSDASENSAEIPLQPAIQLSGDDLVRNS